MSDWHDDDHDWGRQFEEERERDYEHEIAVAQHLQDREQDDWDRRNRR